MPYLDQQFADGGYDPEYGFVDPMTLYGIGPQFDTTPYPNYFQPVYNYSPGTLPHETPIPSRGGGVGGAIGDLTSGTPTFAMRRMLEPRGGAISMAGGATGLGGIGAAPDAGSTVYGGPGGTSSSPGGAAPGGRVPVGPSGPPTGGGVSPQPGGPQANDPVSFTPQGGGGFVSPSPFPAAGGGRTPVGGGRTPVGWNPPNYGGGPAPAPPPYPPVGNGGGPTPYPPSAPPPPAPPSWLGNPLAHNYSGAPYGYGYGPTPNMSPANPALGVGDAPSGPPSGPVRMPPEPPGTYGAPGTPGMPPEPKPIQVQQGGSYSQQLLASGAMQPAASPEAESARRMLIDAGMWDHMGTSARNHVMQGSFTRFGMSPQQIFQRFQQQYNPATRTFSGDEHDGGQTVLTGIVRGNNQPGGGGGRVPVPGPRPPGGQTILPQEPYRPPGGQGTEGPTFSGRRAVTSGGAGTSPAVSPPRQPIGVAQSGGQSTTYGSSAGTTTSAPVGAASMLRPADGETTTYGGSGGTSSSMAGRPAIQSRGMRIDYPTRERSPAMGGVMRRPVKYDNPAMESPARMANGETSFSGRRQLFSR